MSPLRSARAGSAGAAAIAARPPLVALVVTVLGAALLAPVARAQAEGVADEPIDQAQIVVVTATRAPAAIEGVPASTSVVSAQAVRMRMPERFGDAVADVPGLYVRGAATSGNFPATGQAVLSLRGIPRTPRSLVMIDGQPINNALSGGVNVAGVPVDNLERVEVVRGPYSALYGGNAMGGVVNFITAGPDRPTTDVRVGAGSLHQRSATFIHRQRYASGLGVSLSMGYRTSDGDPDAEDVLLTPPAPFPPVPPGTPVTGARASSTVNGKPAYHIGTKGARPWRQRSGQLNLYYSPSAATDLTAGVGWADYDTGYAPPESFLRDAFGNAVFAGPVRIDGQDFPLARTGWFTPTPSQERDWRSFARLEHRFAGGSELRAQLATLRHGFRFVQARRNVASYDSGPGDLIDQPNRRIDADVSWRVPLSPSWTLVSGLSWNRGIMDRATNELDGWRHPDTRGALLTSERGHSTNTAVFVQSEHHLPHDFSVYLGGRYDRFESRGHVRDVGAGFDERYGTRSFGQFSPKVALVWEARDWVSLRTSWGEGFRPPALLDLYGRIVAPNPSAGPGVQRITDPSPDLKPERVRALELGTDMAFAGGTRLSATVYRQRLEDMIYRHNLSDTQARTENAGAAQIDGIEASLRLPTPLRGLSAVGTWTHQFKYEVVKNAAVPESVGKVLTDVPRTTWSAGFEYARGAWSGLLMVRHVGHVYGSGDDLNENKVEGVFGSYDAHTVVAARAAWRIDRHFTLSLAIDNLTDRDYYIYNRQPGRTWYAELGYRF